SSVAAIATCLHRHRQHLGSPEAAQEKRNEQGSKFYGTAEYITFIKAYSTCCLCFHQAFHLRNQNRYEFESDYKHHYQCIHRYTYSLQGREQCFRAICEINQ